MATDAMILTARNDYYLATVALKDAEAKIKATDAAHAAAVRARDDAAKRVNESARHLTQLAAQKPAEPAPKAIDRPALPQGGSGTAPLKTQAEVQAAHDKQAYARVDNAGTVPSLQPKKHKVGA